MSPRPPLTEAHHELLRLLAEIMAEDYVAELNVCDGDVDRRDNDHERSDLR